MTDTPDRTYPPLKIALLLDTFEQRQWVADIIMALQVSPIVEITLVILNAHTAHKAPKPALRRLLDGRRAALYNLYTRFDRWKFKVKRDLFAPVDARPLLNGVPVLAVPPRRTQYSDYFEEADLDQIRGYDLDVALRFGFRILRGGALKIARYGVWSFHHGDNLVNRGAPPGLWEVLEQAPASGLILQMLSEDLDGGTVLYRSWSRTQPLSAHRSRNHAYGKSRLVLLHVLGDLHAHGPDILGQRDAYAEAYRPYTQPLYKVPTNRQMVGPLWRLFRQYGALQIEQRLYHAQWCLAYKFPRHDDTPDAFYNFRLLVPPPDRFWADPFPVQDEGRYWVFFEDYRYAAGRGHIAALELGRKGLVGEPFPALESDIHLSYPFVFRWRDGWWMIPETAKHNRIELYRCTAFPGAWALEAVWMEGVTAKDVTLAEVEGRWWLFANVLEDGANLDEDLFLFYADSPLGPWQPHRLNPVKSDIRGARPAGRLFRWRGDLYRPAQNSAARYGGAVAVQRIERLTPDEFRETTVSEIAPLWARDLVATHTLNRIPGLTVIDGLRRVPRWRAPF